MWSTVFLILEFAMTENTQSTEISGDKCFPVEGLETLTQHRSLWGDVWRQFRKHKGAMMGVIVFIFITLMVSLGTFAS